MKCYQIKEKMEPVTPKNFQNLPYQYVITMKSAEWNRKKAVFDIGMDLDPDLQDTGSTRAEVDYDSLTGGFNIPARENVPGDNHVFAFSLDEKGVIFIDDEGFCNAIIRKIANTKRLVNPCLERFLYDFLEQIICDDRKMLEGYDHTLDELEDQILDGNTEGVLEQIAEKSGLAPAALMSTLTMLQIRGKVEALPGKIYRLV